MTGTGHRQTGLTGVELGLLGLVALAPLPLGSVVLFTEALLAVSTAAVLLAAARTRNLPRAGSPATRWVVASLTVACLLFAWTLVQTLPLDLHARPAAGLAPPLPASIALAPGLARTSLMTAATAVAVFVIASGLARSADSARRTLLTVALTGGVYALYGVIAFTAMPGQVLWLDTPSGSGWATGPFVNRNSFAAYCGLAMIAGIGLVLNRLERTGQGRRGVVRALASLDEFTPVDWALLLACVCLSVALLLTGSRAGSAASGVGLLVMLLARSAGRASARSRITAAAVVAALGAGAIAFGGRLGLRLVGTLETGAGARPEIYAVALRALADRPWTGFGLGGFADAFHLYRDDGLVDTARVAVEVHNDYLELAVELGIPAAVLAVLTLGALALRCLRGAAVRRRGRVYPAVAAGGSALLAVHSLVDFSLQIPAIALVYAALLGIGLAQAFPSGRRRADGRAQLTGEGGRGATARERILGEGGEDEPA